MCGNHVVALPTEGIPDIWHTTILDGKETLIHRSIPVKDVSELHGIIYHPPATVHSTAAFRISHCRGEHRQRYIRCGSCDNHHKREHPPCGASTPKGGICDDNHEGGHLPCGENNIGASTPKCGFCYINQKGGHSPMLHHPPRGVGFVSFNWVPASYPPPRFLLPRNGGGQMRLESELQLVHHHALLWLRM